MRKSKSYSSVHLLDRVNRTNTFLGPPLIHAATIPSITYYYQTVNCTLVYDDR